MIRNSWFQGINLTLATKMKTIWESWTGHAGLLFAVTFWIDDVLQLWFGFWKCDAMAFPRCRLIEKFITAYKW